MVDEMLNNFWNRLAFSVLLVTITTTGNISCDHATEAESVAVNKPIDQPTEDPIDPDLAAVLDPNQKALIVTVPAIHATDFVSASDAQLPPEAEVIGVIVGDQPRAYLLQGMATIDYHVVNDMLNDTPIAVTYCNQSECVQVFTSKDGSKTPLELQVGGRIGKNMMIADHGQRFFQKQKIKPVVEYPSERTTWGQWKKEHPESDIYLGNPSAAPETMRSNSSTDKE